MVGSSHISSIGSGNKEVYFVGFSLCFHRLIMGKVDILFANL